MPVQMELSRIIISEINDQQVIYLKEVDGERTFPILIGYIKHAGTPPARFVIMVQEPNSQTGRIAKKSKDAVLQ